MAKSNQVYILHQTFAILLASSLIGQISKLNYFVMITVKSHQNVMTEILQLTQKKSMKVAVCLKRQKYTSKGGRLT